MTEIEKLSQLEASAKRQGEDIKKIEENIKIELAKSQSSQATKDALLERLMQGAKEASGTKAIHGLDINTGKKRPKITLGNGLQVNIDAFDD